MCFSSSLPKPCLCVSLSSLGKEEIREEGRVFVVVVMEWDFKDFACWDSTDELELELQLELELEQQKQEQDSDLAALVGSISQPQKKKRSAAAGSLLVDLNLSDSPPAGHLFKDPIKPSAVASSSSPSSSPSSSSSSSKRVKSNGTDEQRVSCLVEDCKADLSLCREYHRRHRVCELHSKTPVVTVRGEQKRFCQQCSRFHSLVEFDEVKRSCRKRLNGHNQRRRKPKPESLYFTSNFLSGYKGPRILQFSNPQLCATNNVRSMWPAEAKNGAESMLYSRHPSFNGGDKPFLFLQTNNDPKAASGNRAAPQTFLPQQPFPTTAASPAESRKGGHIMSSDGMTRVIDSGCALYLLSSHPAQASVTQSNVTTNHPGQLPDSRLQMNGSFAEFSCSHDAEDKAANPEMVFLMGPDGFLDNGAQMLPILLE